MDENEIAEVYRIAAEDFAIKDANADMLDSKRKIVFAEQVNRFRLEKQPIGASEYLARASKEYIAVEEERWKARRDANLAKAAVKIMDVKFDYWRTRQATKRQEMRI